MTPDGELTTLVEFTGTTGLRKGSKPLAGLLKDADGYFYGTTNGGGALNTGTVFRMSPDGVFETLLEFPDADDGYPNNGSLIRGTDGNLYGTVGRSGRGGSNLNGNVYRLIYPGPPIVANAPPIPPGSTSAVVQGRVNARDAATNVTLEYWTGSATTLLVRYWMPLRLQPT